MAERQAMRALRVGLIGDRDDSVVAHRAIPQALALAADVTSIPVEWEWVGTDTIGDGNTLHAFDALWCVPASPYRDMDGALTAIRYAREAGVPFLGTCGGFQHAVVEYARQIMHGADDDQILVFQGVRQSFGECDVGTKRRPCDSDDDETDQAKSPRQHA